MSFLRVSLKTRVYTSLLTYFFLCSLALTPLYHVFPPSHKHSCRTWATLPPVFPCSHMAILIKSHAKVLMWIWQESLHNQSTFQWNKDIGRSGRRRPGGKYIEHNITYTMSLDTKWKGGCGSKDY